MKLDLNRSKYQMGWSCNCLCVEMCAVGWSLIDNCNTPSTADLSETTWLDLSNWFERDPWHIERGISGISGRNRTFFIPAGLTSSSPAGVHLKSRLNWRKSVRKRKKLNVSALAGDRPWLYFPKNILAAGSIAQGCKWSTEIRYNSTSSNKAHYLQEA